MSVLALATLLAAAPVSPTAASDVAARDIDEALGTDTVYAIRASRELSLEGSAGEAYVDASGQIQKVTITFHGETYRSDLAVYVRDGRPFRIERITAHVHERVYLAGDEIIAAWSDGDKRLDADTRDELLAMARALLAPVVKCLASAGGKGARCDSVGAAFDPQAPDDDLRVALIKREFERTRAARQRYTRYLLENYKWNMTGIAYIDGAKLRLLEMTVTGAGLPSRNLEFYYGGADLLMSLERRRNSVIRVYYRDKSPIRILDAAKHRVPVNDASRDTFVMPIIEYATSIAPCFIDGASRQGCPTMTLLPTEPPKVPTKRSEPLKPLPPLGH